ncbi:hypothetical protein T484DRAFT_1815571 [Baffinella frigidus]|nr:hypothetical protein T484DRAFT_1815571 [Cryptophyta sp. CCMP2293]
MENNLIGDHEELNMENNLIAQEELNMENNLIARVGDHVSQLARLKIFRLGYSKLTEVSHVVGGALTLGHNKLTEVSEVVGEALTALSDLSVNHNTIGKLPANFSRAAESLTSLDLESNLFPELPPAILSLTVLKTLKLAGNPIAELPLALGTLAFLTEITVPSTDLGSVPRAPPQVGGAAVIRFLCGVAECEGTGLLDLSAMNLHVIPASVRSTATALTMLNLDNNPLQRLPNWLGELQRLPNWLGELQILRRISLRGTPIMRLPATLGAIEALQEVALDEPGSGSSLVSPPAVVVQVSP